MALTEFKGKRVASDFRSIFFKKYVELLGLSTIASKRLMYRPFTALHP